MVRHCKWMSLALVQLNDNDFEVETHSKIHSLKSHRQMNRLSKCANAVRIRG
jgi:hypothetical protein